MGDEDTILIVDDDPGILLTIKALLSPEGYSLITAPDGRAARSMIQERDGQFSAVLMDWDMPGMSGIDVLRWMKGQPASFHTPVIMQTAMDRPENVREGIDAGAFYYLTKPHNPPVLVSIVRAAAEDFHTRDSLLRKLKESENPYRHLVDGTFRFRTLDEGEFVTVRIANACPSPSDAMVLNELVINAIEHGNLGITYDEKTKHVDAGTWRTEVDRRLSLPEYVGRYVEAHIVRKSGKLMVAIEDQGPGFEYRRYLDFDETRVFDNHGRGIAMTRSALEVQYVGRGNRVIVTIPTGSDG